MPQVETLPQSLAKARRIVLKPRLDQTDVKLVEEKIKTRLFSRFGFNARPKNVKLVDTKAYFEPYLIIRGKYALDYCRKHIFGLNIKGNINRIFVGGQEYRSEKTGSGSKNKTFKLIGESYAHYERQSYFILDQAMREIPAEKLPISPFYSKRNDLGRCSDFKEIPISDEAQIEFLKKKIVRRPADVAEIIKENFDITDRTIAYYPMYQLAFENLKNKESAVVAINGITGKIILNGTKRLPTETFIEFLPRIKKQVIEKITQKEEPRIKKQVIESGTVENMILGFPAKFSCETFTVGNKVTAIVGDIDVPSGTYINKTLVIKGSLTMGDRCKVHGNLKILKDVTLGADTIINGNLISGRNIVIGPGVLITGSIQATGHIKIGEHATIERGLSASSTEETDAGIQFQVGDQDEIVSVVRKA